MKVYREIGEEKRLQDGSTKQVCNGAALKDSILNDGHETLEEIADQLGLDTRVIEPATDDQFEIRELAIADDSYWIVTWAPRIITRKLHRDCTVHGPYTGQEADAILAGAK